jgi:tRNA A37 N6-isopentenylltransferase MiaA
VDQAAEEVVSMDRGRVGGVIDGGTVATVRWDELEHRPHRALQLAPPDADNSTADVNRCATAAVRRRELLGGLIP